MALQPQHQPRTDNPKRQETSRPVYRRFQAGPKGYNVLRGDPLHDNPGYETAHLSSAGYIYNIDREVYFNRSALKVFSVNFLEDHEGPEIEQSINEETDARE